MLLPRVIAAALTVRQLSTILPSDLCQPQCPSCKADTGSFNVTTSCIADSPFITDCGLCQQCIITYSIDHQVPDLTALEASMETILNLCAHSNASSQVSALQSQASRLSMLGAMVTLSATGSSTTDHILTTVPNSTSTNRLGISSVYQAPPSPTSNAGSITSLPVNTPTSIVQSGPGPELSQSWIAGPVVGSILGVATIFMVIYCTKRKQKKEEWELGRVLPAKLLPKDEDEETMALPGKPQLHSECIPRKEMENTQVIPPVELPALEPAGTELLTPRDETNNSEKERPLPISPLPALFAMIEMRDERTGGDDSPRHETFYHP